MSTDIRIDIGFLDHPKVLQIERALGQGVIKNIIALWLYARQHRPDGVLTDMEPADIEYAARNFSKKNLTKEFLRFNFLELVDGIYYLKSWDKRQTWSMGQKDRSNKASNAAKKRWEGNKNKDNQDAVSIPLASSNVMLKSNSSNASAYAPSPSPSPSPSPKIKDKRYSAESLKLANLLLDKIKQRNPKQITKDLKVWAEDIDKINRIDGYSFEDINKAIVWCQEDNFWQNNILSGAKLRKQFGQLKLKSEQTKQQTKIPSDDNIHSCIGWDDITNN